MSGQESEIVLRKHGGRKIDNKALRGTVTFYCQWGNKGAFVST